MREGPSGGQEAQRRRELQRLSRPALLKALLPRVGTSLGGFTLESRLGAGSYGTVFRARRGERLFALKLLYLPRAGAWAARELEVLLRLSRVGLMVVEAHGHHAHWPGYGPLFLYIVTAYVPGVPLDQWVAQARPSAGGVARVVLALAEQLERAHAVGVVHRDLKSDNVLVRHEDGQAVLVDFGVGTYPGALAVTGGMLPGSALTWAPEVWRFRRERPAGTRYEATAWDDLWALGVLTYWLLVGEWPFTGETHEELEDAVLGVPAQAPQVFNPRVPAALGAVCLRMLAPERSARYASAGAVVEALREVLARADVAWEVPLGETWAAHNALTELEVADTLEARETGTPKRERWGRVALVGMALLCAMHLCASPPERLGRSVSWSEAVPVSFATPAAWVAWVLAGQELAPAPGCFEGGDGAVPSWVETPAPVAFATHSQGGQRVKTSNDSSTKRKRSVRHKPVSRTLCTLAVGVAAAGCATTQVRATPGPEACPDGAVEEMKRWHISNAFMDSLLNVPEDAQGYVTVREGPGFKAEILGPYGDLESGTVVTGRLILGKERVYGRFTKARLPNGTSFPVCLVLADPDKWVPGVPREPDDGPPGTAKIAPQTMLVSVNRFD